MDFFEQEKEDLKNKAKYQRIKHMKCGSFGHFWEGIDLSSNSKVAMKYEHFCSKPAKLFWEYAIYLQLQKDPNHKNYIPSCFCFFRDEEVRVLVIELLGPDLQDTFIQCDRKFSMKTILNLAIRMLDILEFIHSCGVTHNDIKPSNFVIGKSNNIYLLDFGLSEEYKNRNTGELLPCENYKCPTGTSPFSSIRVHWGVKSGRRDDLSSMAYVLLYFLRGDLPWDYAKCDWQVLLTVKANSYWPGEKCFKGFPKAFADFFDYVENLVFLNTPDYNLMRKIFLDEASAQSIKIDFVYDWEK